MGNFFVNGFVVKEAREGVVDGGEGWGEWGRKGGIGERSCRVLGECFTTVAVGSVLCVPL